MGMFSSIFGKSGSDKADKMRQQAIDAFNAIKTPALADLQVQLAQYVSAGKLTPEQAEAELLSSNAFNDIVTDPALEGAQKQALTSLQEVATGGGMTAIDKARMADITSEQNQVARGRNESIMQGARERGIGNTDLTVVNQLMNEQAAADQAARRGTDVAAEAQARALQAMIAQGETAGKIRGQEFGEEAEKAKAENAIDLFNKQTLNQTNLYNVDTANRTNAANLAAEQARLNANTQTENQNKLYNASQVQQDFDNKMGKAQGVAGTFNAWAGDASRDAAADLAADQAFTGKLIQGGATAMGTAMAGPVGGAAASGATSDIGGGRTTNSLYDKEKVMGYAEGGEVEEERMFRLEDPEQPAMDFRDGGPVPGMAPMPGDNAQNDVVPARLSPGEVVVPRSAMSDDEEFEQFMQQFKPSRRNQPVDESIPMDKRALSNLRKRNMEGQ